MFDSILGRLVNSNKYKLSKIEPIVEQINSLESETKKLKNADFKKKTEEWKKHLRSDKMPADKISKYLDDILPSAFALVKEVSARTMKQTHRDVQLIAGIALHQGKIAEQRTGEGKTLTATLPLYLNSLAGKGAHLVTPNDYLSKHAVGWYGSVYEMLGVSVGVIVHESAFKYDPEFNDVDVLDEYSRHLRPVSRAEAYECDITYGTNHEFGFDYLRDNMWLRKEEMVQSSPIKLYGAHSFAIVDEVDFILIDVARTPLIISSQKDLRPEKYYEFAALTQGLELKTDYEVDEKDRVVTLTELGINKVERKLGVENLYEKDFETVRHVENALKAKELYQKDKDYVVKDGGVIIVDQNTGRLLPGNRWSDGLHQAVEAKEAVEIQPESKTLATISYQNYYRMYDKLAGMTGTAATEAEEFFKIYTLDVVEIPTYKPVIRKDRDDLVYKTEAAKYRAVAKEIAERNVKGQPVLIGTTSVEKSQLLSSFLKRLKIKHEILNAKNHEQEALIIAQAGKRSAVTVSTNMAGRGVDIILGGDPFDKQQYSDVVNSGGLFVIGTERHESRRIDNQLRGRSGRQGDPGESRFFLSLQDDLMRIFGGASIESIMGRLGVDENIPIEAGLISKAIQNAQKKVEGINFDQRRAVVDYDDVMNVQRESIYGMRRRILFAKDKNINDFFDWEKEKLGGYADENFYKAWDKKLKQYGDKIWFEVVKRVTLEVIDVLWMEHIDTMDDLRSGVRLRGYGQVDPLVEYKREGKELFEALLTQIWHMVTDRLAKVEVRVEADLQKQKELPKSLLSQDLRDLEYQRGHFESGVADEAQMSKGGISQAPQTIVKGKKIGRNVSCPCGSGKKYKNCHGRA
ncbi:hypothetical protein A2982_03955 [candidate division WWE3 bacterium RIFCSPLOWO2_01_FULL_39_13]|uniref:Protein translocase subunit SecA n=1 Tax=candidate division WWE3 bacterium RIFCSPLOWO2_01_FULL_39_13 TaxID=1802624 RepID=A0A1F4V3T6_UNCKA|nr:MAG: hypothetical protein A2982_03955 [candidate division WWE3 bacterium RIFCSPLOWO2_01_FULL_39_13]